MDDWLEQLRQIRAEQRQVAEPPVGSNASSRGPDRLLKESRAFEFLRDMRRELLGGSGRIESFDNAGGYDVVLVLMWDGSIAQPKSPRAGSAEGYQIFVAVRDQRLWVNGQPVVANSAEALQRALLEAARNPTKRRGDSLHYQNRNSLFLKVSG